MVTSNIDIFLDFSMYIILNLIVHKIGLISKLQALKRLSVDASLLLNHFSKYIQIPNIYRQMVQTIR